MREEERRGSRKEDRREGGISWNILKYSDGLKGAMGRAWYRLQIGVDPSLFLWHPKHSRDYGRCFLYMWQLFYQMPLFPLGQELCVVEQKSSFPPSFYFSFFLLSSLSPLLSSFLPFFVTAKYVDDNLKCPPGLYRGFSLLPESPWDPCQLHFEWGIVSGIIWIVTWYLQAQLLVTRDWGGLH